MKIITVHYPPPIPVRRFDWHAYVDGYEEAEITGYGPDEKAALMDLCEKLAEEAFK